MAQKITFGEKSSLNIDPDIAEQYKIKADEINEIKTVVNANADVQVSSTDASVVNMRTVTHDWYVENWNNDTLDANTVYFTDGESYAASTSTPVGSILIWPGSQASIPTNYMLCDGRLLSRSEYASLFMTIGTTYGSGDGSTTFAIPDYKGRFPVQADGSTEFNTRGQTGGSKTHTLTVAQMPSHAHTIYANDNTYASGGSTAYQMDAAFLGYASGNRQQLYQTAFGLNEYGGGQSHNNLQPYVVGYYIIKTREEVFTEDIRNLDKAINILQNQVKRKIATATSTVELSIPDGVTKLVLNTIESNTSDLTLDNGGIRIGKNISKIRCSGCMFIETIAASGYNWARITINDSSASLATCLTAGNSVYKMSSISPSRVVSVVEGDIITLRTDVAGAGTPPHTCRANWSNTSLQVEVIE